MAIDAGVVKKVAVAAAGTSAPTEPDLGSNVDWVLSAQAAWTTFGHKDIFTDDGDLDVASLTVAPLRDIIKLKAALSLTNDEVVLLSNGIDEIGWTVYGCSETVLGVDSTITAATEISERGATITKKAVYVEADGQGGDYYPNCVVFANSVPGAVGEPNMVEFLAVVLSYSGTLSGHEWHQRTAA